MRYLLLSTTMIAASVTLPFVDMSKAPSGQPVDPVEVSTLAPMDIDQDMAAAGLAPAALSLQMPEVSGLQMARFLPVDAITAFFTPDDAAPDQAVPDRAEIPQPTVAKGLETPRPLILQDVPPAVLASLEPEFSMPEVMVPDIAVPATSVAETPTAAVPFGLADLEIVPGRLGMASLLPIDAITAFFRSGDDPADIPDAADVAVEDALETTVPDSLFALGAAAIRAAPAPEAGVVPSDALLPLTETVGTLILDTPPATSLSIVSNVAKAPVVQAERTTRAPDPVPSVTPAETASTDADLMEVTAGLLNVRAGPSSRHSVVVGLARGAQAEVIETSSNGWVRIKVKSTGQTGWAFGRYLSRSDDA